MPPKKKPYSRAELFKLLGRPLKDENDKRKERTADLVLEAYQQNLISDEEFKAMGCCEVTTVKRYLYSIVDDQPTRDLIDRYVVNYSMIYSAGTVVFNAFLAYCDSLGLLASDQFIKDITDQTVLKYIILPFKSEISEVKAVCPCQAFVDFWKLHGPHLRKLYPPVNELKFVSWDQPLNRMQCVLLTNFVTHVRYHFPQRFTKFLVANIKETFQLKDSTRVVNGKKREILANDDETLVIFKNKLYHLIDTGKAQLVWQDEAEVIVTAIPPAIVEYVLAERLLVGVTPSQSLSRIENVSLSSTLLCKHIEMSKFFEEAVMMKQHSIAPVSTPRRSYCYIDGRILEDLLVRNNLKLGGPPTLENVFKLDAASWRNASKLARKKKSKRTRKYRKRQGIGRLPKTVAAVQSVSTDGVAISVAVYTFPTKPDDCCEDKTCKHDTTPIHIISFDDGRVNLFQSAQRDTNGVFHSTRLQASKYQMRAKIIKHREWEQQYRDANPELSKAYGDMSKGTWRTSRLEGILHMSDMVLVHYDALKRHHVVDKKHALWRMLLWRKKLSVMSRAYVDTIKKCGVSNDTKLIMAVGNAKFASTGKRGMECARHGGVPTNWKHKIMVRTLKNMGYEYLHIELDEYLSTACCYKCEHRLVDVHRQDGSVDRGLKRCLECSRRENTVKTRNRDLNAALNLWKVADCIMQGLERPEYLKRRRVARSSRST